MNVTPRPRRKKTTPPNWSAGGWPRAEYRLPSVEVLERLSRVDGDQDGDQDDQLELDLDGEHADDGDDQNENNDGPAVGCECGFVHAPPIHPAPAVDELA